VLRKSETARQDSPSGRRGRHAGGVAVFQKTTPFLPRRARGYGPSAASVCTRWWGPAATRDRTSPDTTRARDLRVHHRSERQALHGAAALGQGVKPVEGTPDEFKGADRVHLQPDRPPPTPTTPSWRAGAALSGPRTATPATTSTGPPQTPARTLKGRGSPALRHQRPSTTFAANDVSTPRTRCLNFAVRLTPQESRGRGEVVIPRKK